MATRSQVYAKFGMAAEAAQLFETELGTLLLCARGLSKGWHVTPDRSQAEAVLGEINRSTLGRLLTTLKRHVEFGDDVANHLASALRARNELTHGFYEKHNHRIQTPEGRALMLADLENLHKQLFDAWQVAGVMTTIAMQKFTQHKG